MNGGNASVSTKVSVNQRVTASVHMFVYLMFASVQPLVYSALVHWLSLFSARCFRSRAGCLTLGGVIHPWYLMVPLTAA